MPTMANITIKKSDGTTDITYSALNGCSGDRSVARWRSETVGAIAANRPVFEISAKASSNKQFRLVEGKLVYPETFTDSTTGIVAARTREIFSFTSTIDASSADAVIAEFAAQAANLVKAALVQEVIKSGYGPQ